MKRIVCVKKDETSKKTLSQQKKCQQLKWSCCEVQLQKRKRRRKTKQTEKSVNEGLYEEPYRHRW